MSLKKSSPNRRKTPPPQKVSSAQKRPSSSSSTQSATILQRAKYAPTSLSPNDVQQLQRTLGNQAVGWLLAGSPPPQHEAQAQATPMPPHMTQPKTIVNRSVQSIQTKPGDKTQTENKAPDELDVKTKQDDFIPKYKTWLEERLKEVATLKGNDQVNQVRGFLSQIEKVSTDLIAGVTPDLDKLSKTPTYQDNDKQGYVPPLLIGVTRQFIHYLETNIEGADASGDAQTEGSLYEASTDWNARLGVPQYRTQSDNLIAPEATCNVTAFSMALERLGYSRQDLITTIEAQLKPDYLKTAEGKKEAETKKPEEITVPDSYWETKAKTFLDSVNKASKNYQKVRGGKKAADADEKSLAKDFKNSAQLEDLLDFYLHLKSITRTTINSGDTPKNILNAINPDEDTAHNTTQLWSWSEDTKKKIKECLAAGGAAIYSFYHKGKGESGTHIITIQAVTDTGLIVDDPYGKINPDYLRSKEQDAFAPTGKQGASSRTADYKNKQHLSDDDDWQVDSAQDPTADESLGDSYEISDAIIKSAFFYVVLLERAQETDKKAEK